MTRQLSLALAVVTGFLAGCAALSNQPPTPAEKVDEKALSALPPPPQERYYLLIFGSETCPKVPRYTHTWATVVKAVWADPNCEPVLDVQTISWLPATGKIHTFWPCVEPGRNYELHETMQYVLARKETVAVWGPYEVWHGFHHRFSVQKTFMESGQVGYQCVSTYGESGIKGNGANCIHAITDMDPEFDRQAYPLSFFGKSASRRIVNRVMRSPVVSDPPVTHDWVLDRLGLREYPIERRGYVGPVVPYIPGGPAGMEVR